MVLLPLLLGCAHRVANPPEPVPFRDPAGLPRLPTDVASTSDAPHVPRPSAEAHLRVEDIGTVVASLRAIAAAHGGALASFRGTLGLLQVPVDQFDAAWAAVKALGVVLTEQVALTDATDQYLALDLRIHALTATRDRLVELLAQSDDATEQTSLIDEIEGVKADLDVLAKTRADLVRVGGLADIRVSFEYRVARGQHPDPAAFAWIAGLTPFDRPFEGDGHRVDVAIPDGMVAVSPRGPLVAEGPDGSALWTGRIRLDPRGDGDFWAAAVRERLSHHFRQVDEEDVGRWRCVLLTGPADARPYTWEICVDADPASRKLVVGQAFYPDPAALVRFRPAVDASLAAGPS